MADIKYVSELNFKRGLKGIVDWIKDKYVKAEMLLDGGDYASGMKFFKEGNSGYSVSFGVDVNEGFPYIRTINESTYTCKLAETNKLTEWYWSAANPAQNTLTTFRLTGPEEIENVNSTISFVNTDSNTLTFTANNGSTQNEVKIEKNLPTKEYVDGIGFRTVSMHANKGESNQALTGLGLYKLDSTNNVGYFVKSTANGYEITIVDEENAGDIHSVSKNLPDETRVNALITAGLGSISGVNFQVVQTLPATGVNGVFYLIANPTASGSNIYDEYVWVNKGTPETPDYAFERLGTMDVDLTDYTKESDFTALSNDEVDAILVELGVKAATPTP